MPTDASTTIAEPDALKHSPSAQCLLTEEMRAAILSAGNLNQLQTATARDQSADSFGDGVLVESSDDCWSAFSTGWLAMPIRRPCGHFHRTAWTHRNPGRVVIDSENIIDRPAVSHEPGGSSNPCHSRTLSSADR